MSRSITTGWTGGQYSLFRAALGSYLVVHFASLIPYGTELFSNQGLVPQASLSPLVAAFPNLLALWDSPTAVMTLLWTATLASVAFSMGCWHRVSALIAWYALACLLGRNPLISNPSLPFVGWILLAHVAIPARPFGTWNTTLTQATTWRFPVAIWIAAWIVMSIGYTYSGVTKLVSPSWVDGTAFSRLLDNPLARPGALRQWLLSLPDWCLATAGYGALGIEILFAPLALLRAARRWVWLAMLCMHLGLMMLVDFADLSMGMILLHWFTFDPAWLPRSTRAGTERVFYDGECSLCHRAVRFVLMEDSVERFRLAPLQGETAKRLLSASVLRQGKRTLVVQTGEGALLIRSRAVIYLLAGFGGSWRALSWILWLIPRPITDALYRIISRLRLHLFPRPTHSCVAIESPLTQRFDP